jgi:hypothetical protein
VPPEPTDDDCCASEESAGTLYDPVDCRLADPQFSGDFAKAFTSDTQLENFVPVAFDAWSAADAPLSPSPF